MSCCCLQVVVTVLSCLNKPRDLVSCMATSRRLAALVRAAPLALALGDVSSSSTFSPESQARLQNYIDWLTKYCTGGGRPSHLVIVMAGMYEPALPLVCRPCCGHQGLTRCCTFL